MTQFHIGLVSEYMVTQKGLHVVLDTGKYALLSKDSPIPEKYRCSEFSLDLFQKNYGIALCTLPDGSAVWYPAQVCAVILGAAYRKDGRMLGMEEWTPSCLHADALEPDADVCRTVHDGTISIGLAGGTAAPFFIFRDMPGYGKAGGILREAVERITVSHDGRVFTNRNAERGIIKELEGEKDVGVTLARIDFAYTEGREIIHLQKTTCLEQEIAAGR